VAKTLPVVALLEAACGQVSCVTAARTVLMVLMKTLTFVVAKRLFIQLNSAVRNTEAPVLSASTAVALLVLAFTEASSATVSKTVRTHLMKA